MSPREEPTSVRLDKWLWAARFYKTRSAATEAVQGGKVEVGGDPAKPARALRVGEMVRVRIAPYEWVVEVTGLGERRGTAAQAAALYTETRESIAARARQHDLLQAAPVFEFEKGKPTKKDRRQLDRFRGRE
jgi:ribosome-associated heat shock protein Hsp15